jgi:adenylylsulfate kinase
MGSNIIRHSYKVSVENRRIANGHNSFLIWFTGLSGSGKSTIANALEQALHNEKINTYTLDGDNIRKDLNKDLTFSPKDRTENIRRIAEVAKLMTDAGVVVLAAFVSPYAKDRSNIKQIVGAKNYVEVFVDTSLDECERRDVKGLYKKARAGEIKNMTGVSAPYEKPANADIHIETEKTSIEEAVQMILKTLKAKLKPNNYE